MWQVTFNCDSRLRGGCIQCIYATQYLHIHVLKFGLYATLDKWSNGGRVSSSVFMLHNTYIFMYSRSVCTLPWTSGPTGRRWACRTSMTSSSTSVFSSSSSGEWVSSFFLLFDYNYNKKVYFLLLTSSKYSAWKTHWV